MHKTTVALLVAVLGCVVGSASAGDKLSVTANYATFYIPADSTTYMEIYYSLRRCDLGFVGADTGNSRYAGVLAVARVYDNEGKPVDSTSTYFLSQVNDEAEQQRTDTRLFDYLALKVRPGVYRVDVSVVDDVSKATGAASLKVTVPDYSATGLVSSDLELAYEIRDASGESSAGVNPRLVKEGRLVIPNPSGVFEWGPGRLMSVYSELYGLAGGGPGDSGFSVRYVVKDSAGGMVHDYGRVTYRNPGGSAVLSEALVLDSLKPGAYHLVLEAVDLGNGAKAVTSRQFAVMGGEMPARKSAPLDDVQLMVDIAWFHLSEAEKIQLEKLGPQGKVNLITQFWRDKDDDPSTPENPVYEDAVRKFKYANENFSTGADKQDGWRTDRGRVYITYGPYDEEDEVVMSGSSYAYPYIKWTYYRVMGGCIFIFVNDYVAGATDYRLVHSSHPREKHDPRWKSILENEDQQENWFDADD